MYKIWWKLQKRADVFLLFLKKGTRIKKIKIKQCPKVKSEQAGFCFGKITTLIF